MITPVTTLPNRIKLASIRHNSSVIHCQSILTEMHYSSPIPYLPVANEKLISHTVVSIVANRSFVANTGHYPSQPRAIFISNRV